MRQGAGTSFVLSTSEDCAWPNCKDIREYKKEIFQKKPKAKRELWGGEFWTKGYFVGTVEERENWTVVEDYVVKQGKPKDDLRQLELFE